jgi:hypothetical protein
MEMPENWLWTETVKATVTSSIDSKGEDSSDHTEMFVERIVGRGVYVLRCDWDGAITVNGQYIQEVNDSDPIRNMFYRVEVTAHDQGKTVGDNQAPLAGFICELLPYKTVVREAIGAKLALLDDLWRTTDTDNIIVEDNGTWLSPQSFDGSLTGTWRMLGNDVTITINSDN